MAHNADITAGRCGAPCAGRWCVLRAGHPLGRGRSHRGTPRSDTEKAVARAFAVAAARAAAGGRARAAGPAGDGEPLCGQVDPDLFFPDKDGSREEQQAKAVCRQCWIRRACLQWALDHREPHGVWGGATARERRVMLRHGRPARCTDPGQRAHGTTGRYERGPDEHDVPGRGCRCADCRRANADAKREQDRRRAAGVQPYEDAGPARAWVLVLKEYGIGWKRVAALAGVSAGMVDKLLYGDPPTRQVRPEAAAALLAVWPVLDNLADTAIIDSAGTRLLLQALVAGGWPQRWLARRLGWRWASFSTVMARRDHVAAGTAKAVVALYRDLRGQQPPQDTAAQQRAVSNARELAGRRGWKSLTAAEEEVLSGPDADHGPGRQTGGRLRTEAA
jgi:hypothetical protein